MGMLAHSQGGATRQASQGARPAGFPSGDRPRRCPPCPTRRHRAAGRSRRIGPPDETQKSTRSSPKGL